jgi:MarR family transcriptional regulator, organic hydroperoxide resistance regulator
LLSDLFAVHRRRFLAVSAENGLSPPQAGALLRLGDGDPVPMSELAGALMCDASNVTGIVDRLEARGLVERGPAPHDRRVKMLALTAEGAAVRELVSARMSEPPAPLASLAAADQRALRDLLRRALTLR